MLMFREEKSPEDEIKAWQFWHSRQHSVKQRILDAGKLNWKTFYYFIATNAITSRVVSTRPIYDTLLVVVLSYA